MLHLGFAPSLSAQCSSYVPELEVAITERDAWAFCKKLSEINTSFGRLIQSPAHALNFKKVHDRILQDCYARLIQPNSHDLSKYLPFSNYVYGELMPSFVDRIIELTQLSSSSLFLDLGSGVGSVVAQASLRTGCTSVGVELVPRVAALAQELLAQILFRCYMWGVKCSHVKLEEGDMLGNKDIAELIQHADVILVNNHAFDQERMFFLYTFLAMDSHDS
jgi:SAM-dependent methyltransferase